MSKGFIRILEVFLALTILFTVLDKAYIITPPRYGDPENVYRLHRYAKDIAFSLCNHEFFRDYYINDSLPSEVLNFNWTIPNDIDYRVYIYSNNSDDSKLDDLTNETGGSPGDNIMATASCLISGFIQPNIYEYNATECNYKGSDCLGDINVSDNNMLSISANENFTFSFSASISIISRNIDLLVEGNHTTSGNTALLQLEDGEWVNLGNYSFSITTDENHTFDLDNEFLYGAALYEAMIKPNVSASYDYVRLSITELAGNKSIYSPRKIVVGVWNK